MKVFVSYSFEDNELHLLTLLFERLREKDHSVDSSDDVFENIEYKISTSDIFVGIITSHSDNTSMVIHEWEVAKSNNIKTILLVEKGVHINNKEANFIRFDRNDPEISINKLLEDSMKPATKKKNGDLSAGLVFAGIIVGIAALIALLSDDGKK